MLEHIIMREKIANIIKIRASNLRFGEVCIFDDNDLKIILQVYLDNIPLFKEQLSQYIINIKYNRRFKSRAGCISMTRDSKNINQFQIDISVYHLQNYYQFTQPLEVNGIQTVCPLDALQLVIEHELIHALENVKYGTSNCNGKVFKSLALEIFGHTKTKHMLSIKTDNYAHQDFIVGDIVNFAYKEKIIEGTIKAINKRATINVTKWGKTYKYYVPLSQLKKV